MSSTLGVAVPSEMAPWEEPRLGVSLGTPRSMAVSLTFSGPTSTPIWAYTALTDLSVAAETVIGP